MRSLFDVLFLGVFVFLTIAGANYGKDKIYQEVRELALTKAHTGLGSMTDLAQALTKR